MNGNGQIPTGDEQVLCWTKRLLSADDLRRHLTCQSVLQLLPRTIVTPLAADELRARGVRITCQADAPPAALQTQGGRWVCSQERPDAIVAAALQALEREGVSLALSSSPVAEIAGQIARAEFLGAVVFCGDPALICCLANKYAGLRAAAVWTAAHANRARTSLAANLFAVEMPGRTYFEVRQILRTIAAAPPSCPAALAQTLKELDGHAHR